MRRDEDGLWLRDDEWTLWLMANHPERLINPATDRETSTTPDETDRRDRAEAKQWRKGRSQGLLARSSPLLAELARKGK